MQFPLSISPLSFSEKPHKKDMGKINNSMVKTELSLTDLCTHISSGKAFCPSTFQIRDHQYTRRNSTWLESSCIALDFDQNENFDELKLLFEKYEIEIHLYYTTWSHTKDYAKFRLCIFFDKPFTNFEIYNKTLLCFQDCFQSDKAAATPAHMFQGSRHCTILSEKWNSFDKLIPLVDHWASKNYSKPSVSKLRKTIRNTQTNPSRFIPNKYLIRDFHYEEFRKCSTEFDLFCLGKKHFSYAQLRCLALNLSFVRGGSQFYTDCLHLRNDYADEDFHLASIRTKYPHYGPENLHQFDSKLNKTIQSIFDVHKTKTLDKSSKISLNDAENQFKSDFVDFLQDDPRSNDPTSTRILKASTGLGKTKNLTDYLLNTEAEKVIVAFPTHKLKQEVFDVLKKYGLELLSSPEFPRLTPQNQVDFERAVQLWGRSMGYFVFKRDQESMPGGQWSELNLYDQQKEELQRTDKPILVTHRNYFCNSASYQKKNTVLFDEDPFYSLLPIKTYSVYDFNLVIQSFHRYCKVNQVTKSVQRDFQNTISFMDRMKQQDSVIIALKDKPIFQARESLFLVLKRLEFGHIFKEFLTQDFVIYSNDQFMTIENCKKSLHSNTKIMSATVDPFFYEKLGVNFTDYNVTNIQQQGQVIHYKGSMWSKRRLKTLIKKNELDKLPKTENDVVLTYKELKSLFEKAHPTIHFGHCEGFNELESENLSIVGTPIPHPFMVFLYANALNLEYITQEKRMRKVELDGFHFRMYTYVDENLAQIEIRLARIQIDQLVGRARTLRNDCVVSVYSGIPPSDTTIQRKY